MKRISLKKISKLLTLGNPPKLEILLLDEGMRAIRERRLKGIFKGILKDLSHQGHQTNFSPPGPI